MITARLFQACGSSKLSIPEGDARAPAQSWSLTGEFVLVSGAATSICFYNSTEQPDHTSSIDTQHNLMFPLYGGVFDNSN